MSSEFVLTFNEQEKKFIEEYQNTVIEYNGNDSLINVALKYISKNINYEVQTWDTTINETKQEESVNLLARQCHLNKNEKNLK